MMIFSTPKLPLTQPYAQSKTSAATRRLLQQGWRWCCRMALVQPSLVSYLEPLIRWFFPNFRTELSQAKLVQIQQQGSFVHLTLKPGRRWHGFIPGQHLQLQLEVNGRAISRTFSISSSLQWFQQQGLIRLTIWQQPHGLVTRHLWQWFQPDEGAAPTSQIPIHLSAATGDFVLQQQQPLLLLGAGSGITPIHAMLSSVTRLTYPVLVIYSYRGADQLLFADSWHELQCRFPLLKVQLIDTSCRERLRRAEVMSWLAQQSDSLVYLCGPVTFSRYWQQQCIELGVSPTAIKQESFGLVVPSQPVNEVAAMLSFKRYPIAVLRGSQKVRIESTDGSLLTSLEAAGLNPTYGCRRGICMQCLCPKNSGLVRNVLTGETSDAGPGVIQLCISQPLSAIELQLP